MKMPPRALESAARIVRLFRGRHEAAFDCFVATKTLAFGEASKREAVVPEKYLAVKVHVRVTPEPACPRWTHQVQRRTYDCTSSL